MSQLIHEKQLSRLLADFASLKDINDVLITGIKTDSREVVAGDLFLLLPLFSSQADKYIAAAFANGAVAVVVDEATPISNATVNEQCLISIAGLVHKAGFIAARFYDEPSNSMPVVGITGTNGKTSCTHFFAQASHQLGKKCGVVGTLGNGVWGSLNETGFTTPQTDALQKTLHELAQQNVIRVAMEVSSHGLEQGRVDGVRFEVAVFTNLSRDHLDYHGDMQSYQNAKKRLFSFPGLNVAILNFDDAFGRDIAESLRGSSTRIIGYGTQTDAFSNAYEYIHAEIVQQDENGFVLDVTSPFGDCTIQSALIGQFNAINILAVLASLVGVGEDLNQAAQTLSHVVAPAGRMECFRSAQNKPLVIVDYAHTPDALEKALQAVASHCRGEIWLVFGCGGDRDRGKRAQMAAVAERFAHKILVTDDNPRTESPQQIVADIISGFTTLENTLIEHSREKAITLAFEHASPQDIVLVAGKGHEDYQIIGTEKRHYSDRETVQSLMGLAA